MKREFYSDTIANFLVTAPDIIIGKLAQGNSFSLEQTQLNAWLEEINILRNVLLHFKGSIYFEYSIPRMGKRIDVVCIIGPVIFVLEFKIGEKYYLSNALDQVMDYALDLINFHQTSHDQYIAPILIATNAENAMQVIASTLQNDRLLFPVKCNQKNLHEKVKEI